LPHQRLTKNVKAASEGFSRDRKSFEIFATSAPNRNADAKIGRKRWPNHSGLGQREVAMRDRDLAQAERLITEFKNRIARQREVIADGFEQGHDTEIAISLLRAFEAGLQALEKHRELILTRRKKAERR
jgi:predicted dehydrogenase